MLWAVQDEKDERDYFFPPTERVISRPATSGSPGVYGMGRAWQDSDGLTNKVCWVDRSKSGGQWKWCKCGQGPSQQRDRTEFEQCETFACLAGGP